MMPTQTPVLRQTQQKTAIQKVLERAARPLSSNEILLLAQAEVAQLGIATVYRNIKNLLAEGVIKTVALPNTAPRYELANLAHHHHFQCNNCDKVFDIHGCTHGLNTLAPAGFNVQAHDITLYGQCLECTKAPTIPSISA
jgi:Fur family ferric uptake transcriptional regulator